MLVIQSERLLEFLCHRYTPERLACLRAFLDQSGAFLFPRFENGLFPAAVNAPDQTGYLNVWVRDNVHIAHVHSSLGIRDAAERTAHTLAAHFLRQRGRFEAIIEGRADPHDPMVRPHIRFHGPTLAELPERWPHAQNDALGYFLWLYAGLAAAGRLAPEPDELALLELFPGYFEAIRFWQDEDSGHWEEVRKISASSIGTVVAGLDALERLWTGGNQPEAILALLAGLRARGRKALEAILPAECNQSDPKKNRRYDAALLFLIEPLGVIRGAMGERIVDDVIRHLQGDRGIRRYLGDSFWAAGYRMKLALEKRTADFSEGIGARDGLFDGADEAQWCLFDPVLSTIFGARYRKLRRQEDLDRQTFYLNRALGQLTGDDPRFSPLRCPELYSWEGNEWLPSDVLPLLWTQANLLLALQAMAESLAPPFSPHADPHCGKTGATLVDL